MNKSHLLLKQLIHIEKYGNFLQRDEVTLLQRSTPIHKLTLMRQKRKKLVVIRDKTSCNIVMIKKQRHN